MSKRPTPSSTGVLHVSMKASHNTSPTGRLASSIVSAGRKVTSAIRSLFTTKSFEQEVSSDSSDMIEPAMKEMAARTCGTQADTQPSYSSPIRTPGNTLYDLNQSAFHGTPFPREYNDDQKNLFPLALTTIAALALSQASRNAPIRQITDALTKSLATSYGNPSMAMSALTLTGPTEFTSHAPEKGPTAEAEYVVLPSSILETYMALKAQRQTSALGIQKSTLLRSQTFPESGTLNEEHLPPSTKSRSVRFLDSTTTGSLITGKQTTETSNSIQDSVSISSFSSTQKPTDSSEKSPLFQVAPPEHTVLALSHSNDDIAPTPAAELAQSTTNLQKQENPTTFSFGSFDVKKETTTFPAPTPAPAPAPVEKQGTQGFVFPAAPMHAPEPKSPKKETVASTVAQSPTGFQPNIGPIPTQPPSISGQEKPVSSGFSFNIGGNTNTSSFVPSAPNSFLSASKSESKTESSSKPGLFSFGNKNTVTEPQEKRAAEFHFGSTISANPTSVKGPQPPPQPPNSIQPTFAPSQATTVSSTGGSFSFSFNPQPNPPVVNASQSNTMFQPPPADSNGIFGRGSFPSPTVGK